MKAREVVCLQAASFFVSDAVFSPRLSMQENEVGYVYFFVADILCCVLHLFASILLGLCPQQALPRQKGASMIILGIDPGFSVTGYCILQKHKNQVVMLDHGFLKLPTTQTLSTRVGIFYDTFVEKIKQHGVTAIALETSFLGKNAQTFLKLGYLRGILYLLASQYQLQIFEFAPRQVKQTVTGYGAADKEQVAKVLSMLFPQIPKPLKADVTDAIAISLCGLWQSQNKMSNIL